MKNTILILLGIISSFFLQQECFGQTIYKVTPGSKGNEITLTLLNISSLNRAEYIEVKLIKAPASLVFNKEKESVEAIDISKETDVSFAFDIKREAEVTKTDTVEFVITGKSGIHITKTFVLEFTPPEQYRLEQNFPNPFNPVTTIQYQLPFESKVTLKIYDIIGSEIATLVDEKQSTGYKEFKFNAAYLASGVYIYRIYAEGISGVGKYSSVKKMMLLK